MPEPIVLDPPDTGGMDEPQHLGGDRITDNAGGSIQGIANMSYNSSTNEFRGSSQVESNSYPCGSGTLQFRMSPSKWQIDLGTKSNPITIKPFCNNSINTSGYLSLTKYGRKVGFGKSWDQTSAKLRYVRDTELGDLGFELKAAADLSFNAEFEIDIESLSYKSGNIDFSTNAYITGKAIIPAAPDFDVTLASVSLSGDLKSSYSSSRLKLSGKLDGRISIASVFTVTKGFSFSKTF